MSIPTVPTPEQFEAIQATYDAEYERLHPEERTNILPPEAFEQARKLLIWYLNNPDKPSTDILRWFMAHNGRFAIREAKEEIIIDEATLSAFD